MQIICKNFVAKLVQSVFLFYRFSKNYKNLTTESGSKQIFSLVTGESSHSGSISEDYGSLYKSPILDFKGGL